MRPVSTRPGEEVSEDERQYEDGSDPRVLDVMEVPLLEPKPKQCQQENWVLDPDQCWKRIGRLDWRGVLVIAENPDRLWMNELSTYHGLNDQISLETAKKLERSLFLIHVKALRLRVFRPGRNFGNPKLRVQGQFEYRGERYWLWVTDPGAERTYKAKGEGEYDFDECCLTISLGLFDDHWYKLIAAIIPKE